MPERIPYEIPIISRAADDAWHRGVKPWMACMAMAHESITISRMPLSDPRTPAYMRGGMSREELGRRIGPAVVFGATVEVKGENWEDVS